MRAKDSLKLEALRAIKSAVLVAKTATAGDADLSEEEEIKLLQKLVKQRKDSAVIFKEQNRDDLAASRGGPSRGDRPIFTGTTISARH